MSLTSYSVKLEEPICSALTLLAKERDRSMHWLMHDAIQKYVGIETKKELFRKETLAAWQDYAQTGMHVTMQEMTDWVNSIGTDEEKALPECHL